MNMNLGADGRVTNDFPTKDIYLATAIKTSGCKLVRVDQVGRKAVFVFDNTPELKEAVTSYMNRKLVHECKELFDTWKELKSLVFSVIGDVK